MTYRVRDKDVRTARYCRLESDPYVPRDHPRRVRLMLKPRRRPGAPDLRVCRTPSRPRWAAKVAIFRCRHSLDSFFRSLRSVYACWSAAQAWLMTTMHSTCTYHHMRGPSPAGASTAQAPSHRSTYAAPWKAGPVRTCSSMMRRIFRQQERSQVGQHLACSSLTAAVVFRG